MLGAAFCLLAAPLVGTRAHAQSTTISAPVDSAAALAVVESFRRAIVKGDSVAAVALLDADLVVLESGDMETRKEYLGHHLGADMAFAKAVPEQRTVKSVTVAGDAAWVVSTNRTDGTFQGRANRQRRGRADRAAKDQWQVDDRCDPLVFTSQASSIAPRSSRGGATLH